MIEDQNNYVHIAFLLTWNIEHEDMSVMNDENHRFSKLSIDVMYYIQAMTVTHNKHAYLHIIYAVGI